MKSMATLSFILCLDVAAAPLALAAKAGVQFEATVSPVCTLTVTDNGLMVVSSDLRTLSSGLAGGDAGVVSLSTTGGVTISVDPVTLVTPPAGDATTTTWTPTYLLSGTHSVGATGVATPLPDAGASTVSVNLEGTKSGSDTFAAGSYQATVTVRCE